MRPRTLVSGILFICMYFTTSTVFSWPSFSYIMMDSSQPSPKNVGYVMSVSTEIDPRSLFDPSLVGSVPPPAPSIELFTDR